MGERRQAGVRERGRGRVGVLDGRNLRQQKAVDGLKKIDRGEGEVSVKGRKPGEGGEIAGLGGGLGSGVSHVGESSTSSDLRHNVVAARSLSGEPDKRWVQARRGRGTKSSSWRERESMSRKVPGIGWGRASGMERREGGVTGEKRREQSRDRQKSRLGADQFPLLFISSSC